jgi:glyoxylase-like metal-dependent hydrolase (beta-lactamase superfamily II)
MSLRTGLLACSAAIVFIACSGAPPSKTPASLPAPPEGFVMREIAPQTYELSEPVPWQANMLLAEMPDGELLLVNAPATESSAEQLWRYLRARYGERQLLVVNTHFHMDSIGGNAWLLAHGAKVIGSEHTAALVRTRAEHAREQAVAGVAVNAPSFAQRLEATRIAPPAWLFDESAGLALDFGGEHVQITFPGAAHSPDNVVVFLPRRSVLFAGCMVKGGGSLGFIGDADLRSWPQAIERLKALAPKIVVPGHEQRLDPAQLDHTLQLLAEQAADATGENAQPR